MKHFHIGGTDTAGSTETAGFRCHITSDAEAERLAWVRAADFAHEQAIVEPFRAVSVMPVGEGSGAVAVVRSADGAITFWAEQLDNCPECGWSPKSQGDASLQVRTGTA